MFHALFAIGGSLASGLFLDLLSRFLKAGGDDYYRYIFLWLAVFQTMSMVFLSLVYRGWQRHDGQIAYVPPSTGPETVIPLTPNDIPRELPSTELLE